MPVTPTLKKISKVDFSKTKGNGGRTDELQELLSLASSDSVDFYVPFQFQERELGIKLTRGQAVTLLVNAECEADPRQPCIVNFAVWDRGDRLIVRFGS